MHNALADMVHTWFAASGYRATREACIPALATTARDGSIKDAHLDVQATACDKPDFLIDVTVRRSRTAQRSSRRIKISSAHTLLGEACA